MGGAISGSVSSTASSAASVTPRPTRVKNLVAKSVDEGRSGRRYSGRSGVSNLRVSA